MTLQLMIIIILRNILFYHGSLKYHECHVSNVGIYQSSIIIIQHHCTTTAGYEETTYQQQKTWFKNFWQLPALKNSIYQSWMDFTSQEMSN